MKSPSDVAWSAARAGEALAALAQATRLPLRQARQPLAPLDLDASPERFGRWLELTTSWLGLELEPVAAGYGDVEALLRASGPALLRLPDAPAGRCLVALVAGSGQRLQAIAPDLSSQPIAAEALRDLLVAPLERQSVAEVDAVLAVAGVRVAKRQRARRALLRTRLAGQWLTGVWLLRVPPSAPFRAQLARVHALRRVVWLLLAQAATYTLSIAGWWLVGAASFDGRLGQGWLLGWALTLFTQLPLACFVTAAQADLAIDVALLFKQRLLAGALNLSSEQVRKQGAGQFFGRVLESEAIEALAQGPGFACLLSVIELGAALVLLGLGAAAVLEVLLLSGWLAVSAWLAVRYYRSRRAWTSARVGLTQELIERMQGHRTRLAQRPRERWHEGEDEGVASYLARSVAFDAGSISLAGLVPRGWLLIGLAGFAATCVVGSPQKSALAATLGGVLLAFRALHRWVIGASSLASAAIAWREVAPLFHAAADIDPPVAPEVALEAGARELDAQATPLVEARELVFRYREVGPAVLRGCSLEIRAGDRIVLEGPSGGGKSTFAALLSALRQPEAGLLLTRGLDRQTLGRREWRRRVASAPQFHENHVLSGTLAFNLLFGRKWPPSGDDYRAAEEICRELALDGVIARMPAGLQQMVGETGWQLSHGEKSRLFVARALLQDADVVIFDESFAALDPDTLERALSCVLRRARSLVVIAHP